MITAIRQIIASGSLLGLLLVVLLCGCSDGSAGWLGKWEGNMNIPPGPGMTREDAWNLGRTVLEIKEGGRFYMFAMTEKEGSIRYDGKHAYLKVDTNMGRPVAELGDAAEKMNSEILLTKLDDNTILFDDPADKYRKSFTGEPLKLKRLPTGS